MEAFSNQSQVNYNGTPADVSRVRYGYDFAGNRTWREDTVAKAQTTPQYHDEFYTYDGLHRLRDAQRGQLTGTHPNYTGITNKNFAQDWTLDQLGNWPAFKQDNDGNSSWDVNQTRAHNGANEITEIDSSSTAVTHDAAGNMTTLPTPDSPNQSYATLKYDAWNRLVALADPLGYSFEYDGLNRLIRRSLPNSSISKHYYYNEDWQVLVEADGVEGSTPFTPTVMYSYHPQYVDAIAHRMRSEDSHVFLADANYNVTA